MARTSMRERMLRGELYLASDPELAEHARARELLEEFNRTPHAGDTVARLSEDDPATR